jgi:hypothetical protein
MRVVTVVLAMLALMGAVVAQTTYTTPASPSASTGVTTTAAVPAGTNLGMTTTMAACPNVTPDTACLINELRMTRAEVRAQALQLHGLMLTSRMNQLMADEMLFRQTISANPNSPDARMMSARLQSEAAALNSDIVAFQNELALVPADQRPYLAQSLNTFDVAYWTPAMQRFAQYNTQFQQTASTAYQPAVAANAWLPSWQTAYQSSVNNIAMQPQVFASNRWWTTTASAQVPTTTTTTVLGSTETYPMQTMPTNVQPGSAIYLPAGSVIIIPPSSTMSSSTPNLTTGATGTGLTGGPGAPQ